MSNIYLRGKTDRAFFDLNNTYYFQGLSAYDFQKQLPVVHPVLDYNRRFQPDGIGGELALDLNVTSLSRQAADYVGLPPLRSAFAINNKSPWTTRFISNNNPLFRYFLGTQAANLGLGCGPSVAGGVDNYTLANCLLRGAAGTSTRASASLSWRRSFTDPLGQVWTPFMSAQVDVLSHSLNTTAFSGDPTRVFGNSIYGNDKQTNFLSAGETSYRVMPAIGVEYRYPLIASSSFGSHLFEPIAAGRRPAETSAASAATRMRTPKASCSAMRTCSRSTSSAATTRARAASGRMSASSTP